MLQVPRNRTPIRLNLAINSGFYEPRDACINTTAGRVDVSFGFFDENGNDVETPAVRRSSSNLVEMF